MNKIKMIVVYISPGGQANYMPYQVEATPEDLGVARHHSAARKSAKNAGKEVVITVDQSEPIFKPFSAFVDWETVEVIKAQ